MAELEEGYVKLHRSLWTSLDFLNEPFSEREAFMWLVAQAAWRAHGVRYKDRRLSLERGQLAASIRDLAAKWQWHRASVDRFLKRLKTETVIETASETGVSIITICNYAKYQDITPVGETPTNCSARQERDRSETQTEEGKEKEESYIDLAKAKSPSSVAVPAPVIVRPTKADFERFWSEVPRRVGKDAAQRKFQAVAKSGQVTADELVSGMRRYAAHVRANVIEPRFVAHAATWLNQGRWKDELDTDGRSENGRIGAYVSPAAELLTDWLRGMAENSDGSASSDEGGNQGNHSCQVIALHRGFGA